MVTRSATLRQLIATCWIYQMNTVMNRHTGSSNEVIRMRNSRPGASHTQNDTPPSSPAQTDERASRACCFCWCCCCTCSW